jgi:hypothetical protein
MGSRRLGTGAAVLLVVAGALVAWMRVFDPAPGPAPEPAFVSAAGPAADPAAGTTPDTTPRLAAVGPTRGTDPIGTGSLDGHLGIRDCPAGAEDDLLAPLSLQCWFYGERGAWRLLSLASAHEALVIEAEVSSLDVVEEMAGGVVRGAREDFGEVLVYAVRMRDRLAAEGPEAEDLVVRVQWTPAGGLSMLEFPNAAASARPN